MHHFADTRRAGFASAVLAAAVVVPAALATDNIQIVVPASVGTAGKSIGTFGYKPDTDGAGPDTEAIFVTAYGYSGPNSPNPTISRVNNVSFGQTPTATVLVTEGNIRYHYANGNTDLTVDGNHGSSSFLLNPVQIGTSAPYSHAWTIEGISVYKDGFSSGTANRDPGTSDRVLRYDLNQVTSNANVGSHITTLTNWSTFQNEIGIETGTTPPVATTFAPIRQGAWASDGQSLYQSDVTAAYGGIWKIDAQTGGVQRIVRTARAATISELAVIPQSNGADRILFLGKSGDANGGGINYVDYSGSVITSDSDVKVFLDKSTLANFMDLDVSGRSGTANPWSITRASDGTIYFQEGTMDVLISVNQQGHLYKVTTRDEAAASAVPAAGSSWLRLQTRETVTPGGFQATQVMFTDNGTSAVLGAYAYKPGDFDRDNDVDSADKAQFLAALKPRLQYTGVAGAAPLPTPSKYDLNGNRTVDWKDVKILQQFLDFKDGDVNLDGLVNTTDLDVMAVNYYTLGGAADKTWAKGDLASLDPFATTYLPTAADANQVNLVDLQLIANTWLVQLNQPNLTFSDLNTLGYTGQFRADVITAFGIVPEPTVIASLGLFAIGLLRRRER